MTYTDRVAMIRTSILDCLNACRSRIEDTGKHPIGWGRLNAIAVEIIPFFKTFQLHFRSDAEKRTLTYPDWKYASLYSDRQENRYAEMLRLFEREYWERQRLSTKEAGKYMLMFNTAVADALMCDEVLQFLKSCSLARYASVYALGAHTFEFVVLDLDGSVKGNFCEIVRWKRNIERAALEWGV